MNRRNLKKVKDSSVESESEESEEEAPASDKEVKADGESEDEESEEESPLKDQEEVVSCVSASRCASDSRREHGAEVETRGQELRNGWMQVRLHLVRKLLL